MLGTISAFAFRHRKTKKNVCRGGRSQDLPSTDYNQQSGIIASKIQGVVSEKLVIKSLCFINPYPANVENRVSS